MPRKNGVIQGSFSPPLSQSVWPITHPKSITAPTKLWATLFFSCNLFLYVFLHISMFPYVSVFPRGTQESFKGYMAEFFILLYRRGFLAAKIKIKNDAKIK